MSIDAMRWAFRLKGAPSSGAKFVLIVLADFADEDGMCFPSVEKIADRTDMGASTVRKHLDALEAGGFLERVRRRNTDGSLGGYVYHLVAHGGASAAPSGPPLKSSGGTTAQIEQHQRSNRAVNKPPGITPIPSEPNGSSGTRAHRLPDDWNPGPEGVAFAQSEGMDPPEISREAERFVDYWRAKGGAAARKLDWPATWRNWVRKTRDERGRTDGRTYRQRDCDDNRANMERAIAAADRVARLWDA